MTVAACGGKLLPPRSLSLHANYSGNGKQRTSQLVPEVATDLGSRFRNGSGTARRRAASAGCLA